MKAPSNLVLKTFRGGHAQLVWAVYFSVSPSSCKITFLMSEVNLPSSSLQMLLLFLSLQVLIESPHVSYMPPQVLKGLPGGFSSSGCKTPTLSTFLHRRGVPLLWLFLWPFSGLALTGPCLSCTGDSRAECRLQGGPHESRVQSGVGRQIISLTC